MGRGISLLRVGWVLFGVFSAVHHCATHSAAASQTASGARRLNAGHPYAVQRAEFVLQELHKLSATGIYRTLSLKRISKAATRESVFHYNTIMTLELASPYFSSGNREESYEVMVMEHKGDGHASFSIDSFPEMDTAAMEEFYIQKVEQLRQSRSALFAKIDREVEGDLRASKLLGTSDPAKLAVHLMDYGTDQLVDLAGEGGPPDEDPVQKAAQLELERRRKQAR